MGSDGLFDNLFDQDIMNCVKMQVKIDLLVDPDATSKCLAVSAEIKGYDPTYESPFTIEARAHGKNHPGGKEDDITVIVAQIQTTY